MARDYIKRKYRFKGVNSMSPVNVRFYASFTRDGPIHPIHGQCWQWTMHTCKKGYGRFSFEGRQEHAHRSSYKMLVGPITDDLHVLHKCDNPGCVNPKHLFLGTEIDNVKDKTKKNRQAKGETSSLAKLDEKKVREIRELHDRGLRAPMIGKMFNVHKDTIHAIITWRTWKHVPKEDPDAKRDKALKRLLREFGPSGTIQADFLTEDQTQELYSLLGTTVGADEEA